MILCFPLQNLLGYVSRIHKVESNDTMTIFLACNTLHVLEFLRAVIERSPPCEHVSTFA